MLDVDRRRTERPRIACRAHRTRGHDTSTIDDETLSDPFTARYQVYLSWPIPLDRSADHSWSCRRRSPVRARVRIRAPRRGTTQSATRTRGVQYLLESPRGELIIAEYGCRMAWFGRCESVGVVPRGPGSEGRARRPHQHRTSTIDDATLTNPFTARYQV
jgi:hypothetical protein